MGTIRTLWHVISRSPRLVAILSICFVAMILYGCGCENGEIEIQCYYPKKVKVKCMREGQPPWESFEAICNPDSGDYESCCRKEDGGKPAVRYATYEIGNIGFSECCDENKSGDECCKAEDIESKRLYISQLPNPDLRYTDLDGLVDFRTTKIVVDLPDGDRLETYLKGRVALTGGVCQQPPCKIQVDFVELRQFKENLSTQENRTVKETLVRNTNIWKGKRLADGTIKIDPGARLGIESKIDGKYRTAIVDAKPNFTGKLFYNVWRTTDFGAVQNNRITITGNMADENIKVELTINIWATNCEPVVTPKVTCFAIDQGDPATLRFDSDFAMLANLKKSQDLCDAMLTADYDKKCKSTGGPESRKFTCQQRTLPPPANKLQTANHLKFEWKDANGKVLSNKFAFNLSWMPKFPVTLSVENEWGKKVATKLNSPPVCTGKMSYSPGACGWRYLGETLSHRRDKAWCPEGAFLTAVDLDGGTRFSAHDGPIIGSARCCAPETKTPVSWTSQNWHSVGRRSHQKGAPWCPDKTFLTALDLDTDRGISAHDSPIVGHAQCSGPAGTVLSWVNHCSWTEVGRRSHQRGANWCPAGSYLAAFDLDGDRQLSAHDAPIVGRALCCPLRN